jgi:putative transposase
MARLARVVVPGVAHHVTQRGNNRQDVFFVDEDRRVYLELLTEQAVKYGLEILAYCLMTNHVHLVAIPHEEETLAQAIGRTHFRYTQCINRFHRRSSHLWQGAATAL